MELDAGAFCEAKSPWQAHIFISGLLYPLSIAGIKQGIFLHCLHNNAAFFRIGQNQAPHKD